VIQSKLPCHVCRRQGNGIAHTTRAFGENTVRAACSMNHSEMIMSLDRSGITLNLDEQRALEKGGKNGGAYLESLGKTDLRKLTKPEYMKFLTAVLAGYCADLSAQADEIPF
jgi:isoleucyl-tRNA synthetase